METKTPMVVLTTASDREVAETIARTLVTEMLAACVNLIPGVHSIYRWQGTVHSDTEWLLVIKTTLDHFEAVRLRILSLHHYELPEIIGIPIQWGHEEYLKWLTASVS